MSERKVLNKYYPPDFDPDKVPKLRMQRERQYTVRTMAPFNMRCKTCGDYIYQGKKFNAKTETVQDETYLGLRIYRFYIKCPKCISEISFKTDPENEDYTLEHGATRLFEAAKMLRKATEQEKREREEEEANNPMKVLENRTKDSKLEMEIIENLEELRELNARKVDVDYAEILRRKAEAEEEMLRKQEEEDEAYIAQLFGKQDGGLIKRLEDDPDEDEGAPSWLPSSQKNTSIKRPSDVLTSDNDPPTKKSRPEQTGSKFSSKSALAALVKVKSLQPAKTNPGSKDASSTDSTPTQADNIRIRPLTSEAGNGEVSVKKVAEPVIEPATSRQSSATDVTQSSSHHDDHCPGNSHHDDNIPEVDSDQISRSIQEGLGKRLVNTDSGRDARPKAKSVGLSLLGGYAVSDDSDDSDVSSG